MKFFKRQIKKLFRRFEFEIKRIKKDKSQFPIEIDNNIKDIINICNTYSMTGEKRMYVLSEAVKEVSRQKLEGDLVECGIWKGGNIILFNKLNDLYNLKAIIFTMSISQIIVYLLYK